MPYQRGTHANEEVLEGYSLGSLPEAETDALEEHLLVCPECQDRLEETDGYVRAMRSGLAEPPENPPQARASGLTSLLRRLARPGPAIAFAAAAAAVIAVIRLSPAGGADPLPVNLDAYRSASAPVAPAGRPLELRLDAAGLAAAPAYRVQVVNAAGGRLFEAAAERRADAIVVPVWRTFPEGKYWVRVYDSSHTLLREYGLPVKEDAGR